MRIIDVVQRSEEWERLRNRPTASDFGEFTTPVKGDYSASAARYAAKIVAKRLGVYVEPPPSFWMEWGVENEPLAVEAYSKATGEVTPAGFIMPDHTDDYGGSPDGLVGDDGMVEVKCPSPEKLILWHAGGILPLEHKAQVQGLLWISGRDWLDFWGWHPNLPPFCFLVKPDLDYHAKLETNMQLLLAEIQRIEEAMHLFGE